MFSDRWWMQAVGRHRTCYPPDGKRVRLCECCQLLVSSWLQGCLALTCSHLCVTRLGSRRCAPSRSHFKDQFNASFVRRDTAEVARVQPCIIMFAAGGSSLSVENDSRSFNPWSRGMKWLLCQVPETSSGAYSAYSLQPNAPHCGTLAFNSG